MKKLENESVSVKTASTIRGGELVVISMAISKGKFTALVNALNSTTNVVASDLLGMIRRADTERNIEWI